MPAEYRKLEWKEEKNGVRISCVLDIAFHASSSPVVFLIIPGMDGTVDGFQQKYVTVANDIQSRHGVSVVRIANPFITSFHWESNLRHSIEFITENAHKISETQDIEIRIMAHSAGAATSAQIAWEYPCISRLLLINPATRLGLETMRQGLLNFKGKTTILLGSEDEISRDTLKLTEFLKGTSTEIVVIDGADHNFSGKHFKLFLHAPEAYLFR
jgi:hypothetical protein